MSRLLFQLIIVMLLASCSNFDETTMTEEGENGELMLTDAWICDMKSFEEEQWHYEIYLEDNGDYIAVSNSRILKVSKDGLLNTVILLTYPDDNTHVLRVFNDKIYRFHYDNDFQNFDPTQPIELSIYDFDFNLLSDHILDTKGLIYDVEIEDDNLFGMLVYDADNYTMHLRKLSLDNGLVAEVLLSSNGTSPTNLHIGEDGNYFCTASSTRNNFFYLDNALNVLWEKEFSEYLIHDAKYITGKGIYITGRISSFVDANRPTFVALLDTDGNQSNVTTFDTGERWAPRLQMNDEKICLVQTEPETATNMLLSIIDFDLNIESTVDIPGNIVQSNIIVNENNSFSFVYGISLDPNDPEAFPDYNTRIFKFDATYELPTNTIIQ